MIKERISRDDYHIELSNRKQRILEYQKLINMLNKYDKEYVGSCTFEEFKDHHYPNGNYRKGLIYVLISWDGYKEYTWVPMDTIKRDDTLTLEKHAICNGITDKSVWLWAKHYAKNAKKLNIMVHNLLARKLLSRGVKYQFGVRVGWNISEAYLLDKENSNTLCTNSMEREVKLLL